MGTSVWCILRRRMEGEAPASPVRYYLLFGFRGQELGLKKLVTHDARKVVASNVFKTGHSVRVVEEICKLRKEMGLPRLPPTTLVHMDSLKEVRALMKKTGVNKVVSK